MYWILENISENIEKDASLEGRIDPLDKFGLPFNEGLLISESLNLYELVFYVEENSLRGEMTDNLSLDMISTFAFSEKSKEVLSKNGVTNIQFFPLTIYDAFTNAVEVSLARLKNEKCEFKTITYKNYHIANVVGLIDCVNHQTSDLDYYTPRPNIPDDMPENMKAAMQQEPDNDIDFIRKLVLDDSKIPEDIKIFRLKDCPRILVFKEEIVNAIREAKLTGFVFVPLEKYTDEIPDDDDEQEEETKNTVKNTPENKTTNTPQEAQPEAPRTGGGIVIKRIRRND